jgi:hypothetical protein
MLGNIQIRALCDGESPARHHLDGFVVRTRSDLERDNAVLRVIALCDDGCVPIKPRDPLFQRNPGLLVEFVQFGEMQRVFALGSHGLLHFSAIDRLRSL